tara:strand:- start:473 stop:1918 length:1446 start_codon:yes stop_codon:yes gene_type:complete
MGKHIIIALVVIVLLFIISLVTPYYGSTDVDEYAGSAKFFAGMYNADIRASHSMFFGFVHAPLVLAFGSFLGIKIVNLIILSLIIFSVYWISGKDKRALFLILASPLIWYMGPWINPIQIAGLLFLWGFFFMEKFDKDGKMNYVIYSGILIGLAGVFWNTVIYIFVFLLIAFFYNRNVNSVVVFALSFIVGLLPLFIFEQYMFGFFLFSITKTVASNVMASVSGGGIYSGQELLRTSALVGYLAFLVMVPLFIYTFFLRKNFVENKRAVIFMTLVLLFYLINPQIRYLIFLYPIFVLYLAKILTKKKFLIQASIFVILSLLVINPYLVQTKYSTDSLEFGSVVGNFGNWEFEAREDKKILKDLSGILMIYRGESFVVGPESDRYAELAFLYWGNDVGEFVSIQDYNLAIRDDKVLFEKRFETSSSIDNRRQIWIEGGMSRNPREDTDYDSIKYAISFDRNLGLEEFELIESYEKLFLFEKK